MVVDILRHLQKANHRYLFTSYLLCAGFCQRYQQGWATVLREPLSREDSPHVDQVLPLRERSGPLELVGDSGEEVQGKGLEPR